MTEPRASIWVVTAVFTGPGPEPGQVAMRNYVFVGAFRSRQEAVGAAVGEWLGQAPEGFAMAVSTLLSVEVDDRTVRAVAGQGTTSLAGDELGRLRRIEASAREALEAMCRAVAPDHAYTDAVDMLDEALHANEP